MGWFSEHEVFCSFFIIAEFPFRVYGAVFAIINEMLKYDKWSILTLKKYPKPHPKKPQDLYYMPVLDYETQNNQKYKRSYAVNYIGELVETCLIWCPDMINFVLHFSKLSSMQSL